MGPEVSAQLWRSVIPVGRYRDTARGWEIERARKEQNYRRGEDGVGQEGTGKEVKLQ